ncbi:MAG: nucleotidyltransferase domain-containing protein [Solirubrobacterales bacterium]
MSSYETASLSEIERRVLNGFVEAAKRELGDRLQSIWLYGSRARGEPPGEDSDIDLLVIAEGNWFKNLRRMTRGLWAVAEREGGDPTYWSVMVHDPEWLRGRRNIESFFIQEVDRDKIVLAGEP